MPSSKPTHRCAKLKAQLPGASQMRIDLVCLPTSVVGGLVSGISGALTGTDGELVGSTVVDLEDRWYFHQWHFRQHTSLHTYV